MAEDRELIQLQVITKTLEEDADGAKLALGGLLGTLVSIKRGVEEAFRVRGLQDYRDTVKRFGKELADDLLVLQLSFGRMKYAIAEAAAPIAQVLVPALNQAIWWVIRASDTVGQFLSQLLAAVTGKEALAKAADNAASSEKKLASAASSAGKALRRSLMNFDELQRLNALSGSRSTAAAAQTETARGFTDEISPGVREAVQRVLEVLEPLRQIDLSPLRQAFARLGEAAEGMGQQLGDSLNGLWHQLLAPFAGWILERFAPVLTDSFTAGLQLVSSALEPVTAGLKLLWQALEPVVAFVASAVVQALEMWNQAMGSLAQVFAEKGPVITGIFQNIAQLATQAWAVVQPVLQQLGSWFREVFDSVARTVGSTVGFALEALQGLSGYLSGAFTGNWKQAWEGIRLLLKSTVNGIIALLNGMLSRITAALNGVVRAANRMSFTVPSWVPGIGGSRFAMNLPLVNAPQIPYLAQGAVLPANRPFLAMVGDQRHGTNIEAPLSTIQEAVALVLGDQLSAMMAGFEALLEENRLLRQTVAEIEIGDTVIGQAATRYQRRQNYLNGGVIG